ncbi:MAG: diguanylate cyclase [Nitrospirales bacterium]|nr:diguanylate cyclase [Nitrospira sp.]MDR4502226.1 diguanylate cyclase [Nitrospirales bacterium]
MNASDAEQKKLWQIFGQHDVSAVVCRDGPEALQYIQEEYFDFICVSVPLAQTSEKHLWSTLKTSEWNQRTPLFMLTSASSPPEASSNHDGLVRMYPTHEFAECCQDMTALIILIQEHRFFKGHILYVDGHTSAAMSMRESLQRMGLTVTQCASAQQAFQMFEQEEYDLVVIAIGDKGASRDCDLIQTIRSIKGPKSQRPILAICRTKKHEMVPEVLNKGANDYIGKLVVEEELQCRVRNLLLIKNLRDKVDAQERELRQLVMTDELTSLYSKPYLLNAGSQRTNEAHRHGYPLSLVVLSVDHFERLIDQFGQILGDLVLQEMATILKAFSREEDIVARTNDDEFAIAFPHCSELDALAKVDRLRQRVESANPGGVPVTASFGVASLPLTFPCDFEDLFSAADRAMTQAKSDGHNRVVSSELVPSDSGLLKVVLTQRMAS